MAKRRKKYEQLHEIAFDLTQFMENKAHFNGSYTITTNGGKNILWDVRLDGNEVMTLSTDAKKHIKASFGGMMRSLPVYRHCILSDEGIRDIKLMILEYAV